MGGGKRERERERVRIKRGDRGRMEWGSKKVRRESENESEARGNREDRER